MNLRSHLPVALLACCVLSALARGGGDDPLPCQTEIVFAVDFGSGLTNPGPPQPVSSITYCYEDLTGTCPSVPEITPGSIYDGSYSILNNPSVGLISPIDSSSGWIDMEDHTPGDTGGYMLVVNADFDPGEFFRLNDIAVVEGESYAFTAWFANVLGQIAVDGCGTTQVPVNVKFVVEDATTGGELGTYSTGDIYGTGIASWEESTFQFVATSNSINVVLANNGPGGCGNDFAIDDISLTGCIGNTTTAVDDKFIGCEETGLSGNLLDNDSDEELDGQAVLGLIYDSNGDGMLDAQAFAGEEVPLVDLNSNLNEPFGFLTLAADGSFELTHTSNSFGNAFVEYVVCDSGIPVICDTALAEFGVNCEVLPCVIPNYLSPNGDGFNDYFEIPCAPNFEEFELMIYNRWGNQVYRSSNGYRNDWDGTWSKNGEPLPDGTYFYVIRFNDVAGTTSAGDLLLIR